MYTQGPLRVLSTGDRDEWLVVGPQHVGDHEDGDYCQFVAMCYGFGDDTESKDNATLFAAAPELLEACRGVFKSPSRFLEGGGVKYGAVVQVDLPGEVWDGLLAAISKAKGGCRRVSRCDSEERSPQPTQGGTK